MNRCRASLRLLVLAAFALIGALPLANGQPGPAARDRLTPAEAFDDVDVLMQTLSAVHPNLHFHATPRQVAALRATAEATFVRDVTREEFYTAIEPLVRAIGEKHTRLIPPAGTADAQPTPSRPNYRWDFKLLPEGIGYLDFVSMDSVGRADWDVFLERTFARIREQHVRSLIVDLRRNGGGDSRLGDDLLNYLTSRAYRPLTRKTWRLSHLYMQSEDFDRFLDGFNDADALRQLQRMPTAEERAYFAQNPPVEFKVKLAARLSPAAREVLALRAPHWLQPTYSPASTSEWLRQDIPWVTPAADWPLRFIGRTCFLVGPDTFSSAVILADSVKNAHLATIIGEETQPCNQFGELYVFVLPHSRLNVWVPSAQFVRANGDAADARGVIPDLPVHQTESDTRAGIDTVLAAGRRWAAQ